VGRRRDIEMLEDRLVLAATVLPQISLLEATTRDASSVTLDYSISKTNITHALTFDIYRSDSPVLDASSRLLGESTIDPSNDSQDLTQATHEVTLIPGTSLPPNQALPYIVVVADRNGAVAEDPASVNTTYFRTYLLGVVVHGMESTIANATPAWETSMASDLKTVDHYDNTIAFNWVKDSTMAAPGEATKAGDALYSQIVAAAGALDASHAGDVVDLHLIGHSRGAVVVSRALQDVASQHPRALAGSYTKVTLLDPHPANVADAGLYSAPGGLLGLITVGVYLSFESATKDPEVVLPANAGIKDIEVYYQHTPASGFSIFNSEFYLNLWGEGPTSGLSNQSGVSVQWHNLTSVKDPAAGLIGHAEIHAWYQLHVVDAGSTLADVSGGASAAISAQAVPATLPAAAPAAALPYGAQTSLAATMILRRLI
jgi:hypothetical protein